MFKPSFNFPSLRYLAGRLESILAHPDGGGGRKKSLGWNSWLVAPFGLWGQRLLSKAVTLRLPARMAHRVKTSQQRQQRTQMKDKRHGQSRLE
jgi:hypothetical protein